MNQQASDWARQALQAVLARAFLAAAKEHEQRADEARRMGQRS